MTPPVSGGGAPELVRGDRTATAVVVLLFGFALGQGMLVIPLLALAAGYDAAAVGLLASVSAISQVGMRLTLPRFLARFPDRTMMATSCATLMASYLVLLASDVILAFVVAQLLQGTARAFFWTSSQTHALRSPSGSQRGIAITTVFGNIGTMFGPAVAGVIATFVLHAPLVSGIVSAAAALIASRWLDALPVYERRTGRGRPGIWRRPGVDLACWSNVSTGGWRAMLNSYVPVVLDAAGHPPAIIGVLLALADALVTTSAATLSRRPIRRVRRAIGVSVAITATSLAVFPFVAGSAVAAAIAIAIQGLASGVQMTLGPALAGQSVAPGEQGEAVAVAGTFRAASLLATPAAVSASLAVLALPVAIATAAVVIAIPTAVVLARTRAVPSPARPTGG